MSATHKATDCRLTDPVGTDSGPIAACINWPDGLQGDVISMPTAQARILSVIPPMTQLNTPYPSTAYLTGFLHGIYAT